MNLEGKVTACKGSINPSTIKSDDLPLHENPPLIRTNVVSQYVTTPYITFGILTIFSEYSFSIICLFWIYNGVFTEREVTESSSNSA